MTASEKEAARADRLYAQYGTPLERDHSGEYLAVSLDGRMLLAPSLLEAVERAADAFGPGNYVFRIGTRTVGSWLWLLAG
jgi:hypothetical protein